MLSHLEFDHKVLARINARVAREHEEKFYRPTAVGMVESPVGNVLIVKSAKSNKWGMPQGGIESGECAVMGLFRELGEEVGVGPLVAKRCRFCYATRVEMPGCRDGFVLGKSFYFFHVECGTFPEVSLQKDEVNNFCWLAPHAAVDFLVGRASLQKVHATSTALARAMRT